MTNVDNLNQILGKKAKALYPYKANFNDELTFKNDDIITIIQLSDDGTWLEGTLGNKTGWFPSNYVQLYEEELKIDNNDLTLRIEAIQELRKAEESFMDEINRFLKFILIPLQVASEPIISNQILDQLQNSIDDLVKVHRALQQTLYDIPENCDAKIGGLFLNLGPLFKTTYESFSKANPKFILAFDKEKDAINKYFEQNKNITQNAVVFISKSLSMPFKQLEVYVKILKDIHRATQDFHSDRGDVQRAIEIYDDLTVSTNEIRKKKDYELEIMSTNIRNLDEDLFINGESLFLSTVLVIYENGEKKDQILILFPAKLVILSQSSNKSSGSNELNFERKINLANSSLQASVIDLSSDGFKYCFEITGSAVPNLKFVCSTAYDLKTWLEMLNNTIIKTLSHQTKSQGSLKGKTLKPTDNTQKSFSKSNSPSIPQTQISPSSTTLTQNRKQLFMRSHPPLQTHFQLPNDTTPADNTSTLKRLMYKKPQISEPTGKYYGADDDLKLLNVIESYWKSKIRQSLNINVQEAVSSVVNKTNILPIPQKVEHDHIINLSKKPNDEKINIEAIANELNELKKMNKDLKVTTSTLQKQLEKEKISRKKLEQFIRKNNKTIDITTIIGADNESAF